MNSTIGEQVAKARQWITENFPHVDLPRTGSNDQVRHFVNDNYPAAGWFGFLADNCL